MRPFRGGRTGYHLVRSEFDNYKTNDSHSVPHPKTFYRSKGFDA